MVVDDRKAEWAKDRLGVRTNRHLEMRGERVKGKRTRSQTSPEVPVGGNQPLHHAHRAGGVLMAVPDQQTWLTANRQCPHGVSLFRRC